MSIVPATIEEQSGHRDAGRPLETAVRLAMQSAFDVDFSNIRVHRASRAAAYLGAAAYTRGDDIHFAPGRYRPDTRDGLRMLGHELGHVTQQRARRVRAPASASSPVVHDPARESEADLMGDRAAAGEPVGAAWSAPIAASGPAPVQLVGGRKYGLSAHPGADGARVQAVHQIHDAYKQEVRRQKFDAYQTFKAAPGDGPAQAAYSEALRNAELTRAGLGHRLAQVGYDIGADGSITHRDSGAVVAHIHEGDDAYYRAVDDPARPAREVFRRRRLVERPDDTQYVKIGGRFVRRYAYRGVTPPELAATGAGQPARPLYHTAHDRRAGQAGMHFAPGQQPRQRNADKSDLHFLQNVVGLTVQNGQIPEDSLAFLHQRRGVGKAFSATSTPKQITSNAGHVFTGNGRVRLDLAQLGDGQLYGQYASGGAAALGPGGLAAFAPDQARRDRLGQEVERARQSMIRNRELVLESYPAAAVRPVDDVGLGHRRGQIDAMAGHEYLPPDEASFGQGYARGFGQAQGHRHGSIGAPYAPAAPHHRFDGGEFTPAYASAFAWAEGTRHGQTGHAVAPTVPDPQHDATYRSAHAQAEGARHGADHAGNGRFAPAPSTAGNDQAYQRAYVAAHSQRRFAMGHADGARHAAAGHYRPAVMNVPDPAYLQAYQAAHSQARFEIGWQHAAAGRPCAPSGENDPAYHHGFTSAHHAAQTQAAQFAGQGAIPPTGH